MPRPDWLKAGRIAFGTFLVQFANLLCSAPAADTQSGIVSGSGSAAYPIVPAVERFGSESEIDNVRVGRILLGELSCTSCHALAEEPAGVLRKQAPILDAVGSRVRPDYLRRYLQNPHTAKPGATMPDVLSALDADARGETVEALVHFLASTGTVTEASVNTKAIDDGRKLFHQVGCVACHDPQEDNTSRFPTSVPLVSLADKYSVGSLTAFLQDPLKVRPSGRMPGLNLSAEEARSIAGYLLRELRSKLTPTVRYTYYEGNFENIPDADQLEPKAEGETIGLDLSVAQRRNNYLIEFLAYLRVERSTNYNFHLTSDDGSRLWIDGKEVVANDGVHGALTAVGRAYLTEGVHEVTVALFNAGGDAELRIEYQGGGVARQLLDPVLHLTREDAERGGEKSKGEPAFQVNSDLAAKGQQIFVRSGCASCHRLTSGGTPLKSSLIAKPVKELDLDRGCLAESPSNAAVDYDLSGTQRDLLSAAIVSLKHEARHIPTPQETTAHFLATFNCYACHQRDQVGGVEHGRNEFFKTTQKEMGDEGRIPPHLDGVGAKLQPDYLKLIFSRGAKDRPYMLTRMPRFGERNVGPLQSAWAQLDSTEPVQIPEFAESARRVKAEGRHLVGDKAFGCVKCHNFGGVPASGIQSIDMTVMTKRLRRDWFHRYLVDPAAYRPGTRMPAAWPMGQSPLKDVLNGSAEQQIEAVWRFLSDGVEAPHPFGVGGQPIELAATDRAVIYRNFIDNAGPRAIAIAYPEKANMAFDANDMRLAMIWQGPFIDASKHWLGRGAGFQPPLGDNVLELASGAPIAKLEKPTDSWPTPSAKELGYRFRGYELRSGGRPVFRYEYGTLQVEDFPNAITGTPYPTIERTLSFSSSAPEQNLWFRAVVAKTIEPTSDGSFVIDGEWRMQIEAANPPEVRRSDEQMELRVPITFSANAAKIVQRFAW